MSWILLILLFYFGDVLGLDWKGVLVIPVLFVYVMYSV